MDWEGPAQRGDGGRFLLWYAGRIEVALRQNSSGPYAVGNQLSLADVLMYNTFAEVLRPEDAKTELPSYRREPFGSYARTEAALAKFPRIVASVNAVASHPNIQRWLAGRGKYIG